MIDNKDLVNQLHEILDAFVKNNLDPEGQAICRQDLARLRRSLIEALNDTRALKVQKLFRNRSYNFLLNDVVPLMEEIIQKIDHECKSLETEMHGTQNYSDYENEKLKNYSYKKSFKETLISMLTLIRRERMEMIEVSDIKLSSP